MGAQSAVNIPKTTLLKEVIIPSASIFLLRLDLVILIVLRL